MTRGFFVVALWCGLVSGVVGAPEREQDAPTSAKLPDSAAGTEMVFSFVPRTTEQALWEMHLRADRSGWYRESRDGAEEQPIHVSEAVWNQVARGAPAVRSGNCETRQKGLAKTGVKTFSLVSGATVTRCTFNYSDSETLNDAAGEFLALAEMMQEGAKLQRDHRFDRLALDADMDGLVSQVQAGRAVEPGNIAPVLQAIVDDDRVIDRVRRKAARLLQDAGSEITAGDKPR